MRQRGLPENLPGISAPEKTLGEQLKILRQLIPFIWPKGEVALKVRVCIALTLMCAAKLFNILVPYFYKKTVDQLSSHAAAVTLVPVALIVCYGMTRAAVYLLRTLPSSNMSKKSS